MGVGGLAGATVCGLLAATEPATMPVLTRVVLAALACIGLFWAAFSASILRRGTINSARARRDRREDGLPVLARRRRAHRRPVARRRRRRGPAGLVLLPLVTLVLATVVVIGREVRQAELRLQRRLLEIEYRLARLGGDQPATIVKSPPKSPSLEGRG